jgi:predicted permease
VLALLLIGGVNLINLLLIRATGRAKEFAVRQALGAGRVHLAREVLLETFFLAMFGGLLGLGVGAAGVRLLATLGTGQLPLGAETAFDFRLAAISLGGTAFVGVLLAVPIIVFNLRARLAPVLQAETRGGTVSRAAQRVRHGFIIAQVALAFALLTGAGMFGISLKKVLDTPSGFQPDHLLTASISMPWKNYPEPKPRQEFLTRLLAELRAQPGVKYAAFGNGMPFSGSASNNATAVEGVQLAPGESIRTHYTSAVIGDYWQALGISLIEGRFLDDSDQQRDERVCVVDQEFARRYWPGESALGRRIASDPVFTEENATTIVGVVSTVKQSSLTTPIELGAIFFPYKFGAGQFVSIMVRTEMAPEAMGTTLAKVVLSLDPELPVDDIRVMQDRIDESLLVHRSPALLAAIFASVALILAAVGTYGVLAYAVNQRRREIGVRMALGAMPNDVLKQFLGLGAKLLLAGTVLGFAFAWIVGRAMQSILFDVGTVHPGVLIATAVLMSVVVLLASLLPSRRASLVSPIEALRDD